MENRLTVATGYLELGMVRDADAELRRIDRSAGKDWRVLALRVAIYEELGSWDRMLDISRYLSCVQPDDSQWAICTAQAMRRLHSIEAAREWLLRAERSFPGEAAIPYHLACYEAELGDLEKARRYLRTAFKLNPAHRALAREDPKLAAVMRKG